MGSGIIELIGAISPRTNTKCVCESIQLRSEVHSSEELKQEVLDQIINMSVSICNDSHNFS